MQNLKGLRVLVTRPAPAGNILCEKITASGGEPLHFPTFKIEPPRDPAGFAKAIQELDANDFVLFISPQAVLMSQELIHHAWPILPSKLKFIAMGEGTANSLKKAHLPV